MAMVLPPSSTFPTFYIAMLLVICLVASLIALNAGSSDSWSYDEGYTEEYYPSNPCSPSPCRNGGTCKVKKNDNYSCTCKNGYSGKNCENNACYSRPCKNRGKCRTCTSAPYYRCTCRKPYFGKRCQKSPCLPNPCQNNGRCKINGSNGYKCRCKNGYRGKTCRERNGCTKNRCKNGGTCRPCSRSPYYRCSCVTPYYGNQCQSEGENDEWVDAYGSGKRQDWY